jgi:hypothetical protein
VKHDKKKILPLLFIAIMAVLLYLPWAPIVIRQFTRVSDNYWIDPIRFSTICRYVLDVFSTGNIFISLFFFIVFCGIFVFAIIRKNKTKTDFFAFGVLCGIIMLALFGISLSILIRPLFVSRYLIPACGLVWLFFAIECGSIKNYRIMVFICSMLFLFGIMSFSTSFYNEKKEHNDFNSFYNYLVERVTANDIFVFIPPEESGHMIGNIAYLFPGHIQATSSTKDDSIKDKVFDATFITYNEIQEQDKLKERSAWIFLTETGAENSQADFYLPQNNNTIEFSGNYGWGWYKFKLYQCKADSVTPLFILDLTLSQ